MTSRADHEKDPVYSVALHLGSSQRLKLGTRLGRGGEGSVYAAANRRNHAVKLYKTPDKPDLADKISAMVDAGLARQSPFAAFPVDVVRTEDGAFAGFLMQAVRNRRPLHDLYAPGARKQHFPDIDYRFLARTATNIARAVASIHQTGCVIGDINPSGMLVAHDATVALVDADSFQFRHGNRQFLCAVGVPDYTPPELQGQSFHGVERTHNHDAFGLAVILFQVLMMGRHPFDGVPDVGEAPPMGERIQKRLYPHVPGQPAGLQPPPGLPALPGFSAELAELFARAFTPPAGTGRPHALQWVAALERFEKNLHRCRTDRRHHYPREAGTCPWCQMEERLGNRLFPQPGEASPAARTVSPDDKSPGAANPAPVNLVQRRFRGNLATRILLAPWRALRTILHLVLAPVRSLLHLVLPWRLQRAPTRRWQRSLTGRLITGLARTLALAAVLLGLYHLAASRMPSLPPVQHLATQAGQHIQPWLASARHHLPDWADSALYQSRQWMSNAWQALPSPQQAGNWIQSLWGTTAPDAHTPKRPPSRPPHQTARLGTADTRHSPAATEAHLSEDPERIAPDNAVPTPDSAASIHAALASSTLLAPDTPRHRRRPLTLTDKILDMQQLLHRHGYPVPLNGSFDHATRRYAADYLTSITGQPTSENLSVQEFHAQFESLE